MESKKKISKEEIEKELSELKEFLTEEEFRDVVDYEYSLSFNIQAIIQNYNLKFDSVGTYGLSTEIIIFNEIFPNLIPLKNFLNDTCDIYIINISFGVEKTYEFIRKIMPKPLILLSCFDYKFKEIPYYGKSNILFLQRPIKMSKEDLEEEILNYLNSYDVEKEKYIIKKLNYS